MHHSHTLPRQVVVCPPGHTRVLDQVCACQPILSSTPTPTANSIAVLDRCPGHLTVADAQHVRPAGLKIGAPPSRHGKLYRRGRGGSGPGPLQAALPPGWIIRGGSLVVCGPAGTGKTFLLKRWGRPPSKPAATSPGSPRKPSASCCADTAPTTRSPRPSPESYASTLSSSTTSDHCPSDLTPPKALSLIHI